MGVGNVMLMSELCGIKTIERKNVSHFMLHSVNYLNRASSENFISGQRKD